MHRRMLLLIRFHRRGHLRTVMPRTGYVEYPRGHSRYLPCRAIPAKDLAINVS